MASTSILNKAPLMQKSVASTNKPLDAHTQRRLSTTNDNTTAENNKKSIWLDSYTDLLANISCYTAHMMTCDLNNDGNYKLLIADISEKKLKLYNHTVLHSEYALLDQPVGITAFYSNNNIANVAVAAGSYIFIYRNLRPYYKFTVPNIDIDSNELKLWNDMRIGLPNIPVTQQYSRLYTELKLLHQHGTVLTTRSIALLALNNPVDQQTFIELNSTQPLIQSTVTTCITSIQQSLHQPKSVSMLIVGTEHKQLYVLDSSGTSIIQQWQLPSVPVILSWDGLYDIDYRVSVACRNGCIYTIKNHKLMSTVIELQSQPVALHIIDKSLLVATSDSHLQSYSVKGKLLYTVDCSIYGSILCLSVLEYKLMKCAVLATSAGNILVYNTKYLIDNTKLQSIDNNTTNDPITGMYCGVYGRQDNCLLCVHRSGQLSIKILQRHANLDIPVLSSNQQLGSPMEQDIPLPVPKKTRLYVEQTKREIDQCVDMHKLYQHELCRLKLYTTKQYVNLLTQQFGTISNNNLIQLNCSIQGLGPLFRLKLGITNTSTTVLYNLCVTYTYNQQIYKLSESVHHMHVVTPGIESMISCDVQSIDTGGRSDNIRVYVVEQGSTNTVPLLAAMINMPQSEPSSID